MKTKNIWRKNKMDVQIKKTIKAGNSSAVVLPRAWLNKEVRIELVKKTPETILHDVLEILKKNIDLASVIGVYLDATKEKLEIVRKYIDKSKRKNKKYLEDKIAYTLILRIRTLEIIKNLAKNKDYSNKDFLRLIKRISKSKDGNSVYERYLAVKNNMEEKNGISIEEADKLYEYLKKD